MFPASATKKFDDDEAKEMSDVIILGFAHIRAGNVTYEGVISRKFVNKSGFFLFFSELLKHIRAGLEVTGRA